MSGPFPADADDGVNGFGMCGVDGLRLMAYRVRRLIQTEEACFEWLKINGQRIRFQRFARRKQRCDTPSAGEAEALFASRGGMDGEIVVVRVDDIVGIAIDEDVRRLVKSAQRGGVERRTILICKEIRLVFGFQGRTGFRHRLRHVRGEHDEGAVAVADGG